VYLYRQGDASTKFRIDAWNMALPALVMCRAPDVSLHRDDRCDVPLAEVNLHRAS
jgi:hypothetical protein